MGFLEVNHIDVFYGDVQVVFDLSLHIEEGEVVSIIGGNGAGKSTLLRTISGLMNPRRGKSTSRAHPSRPRRRKTSSRRVLYTFRKAAACFPSCR